MYESDWLREFPKSHATPGDFLSRSPSIHVAAKVSARRTLQLRACILLHRARGAGGANRETSLDEGVQDIPLGAFRAAFVIGV